MKKKGKDKYALFRIIILIIGLLLALLVIINPNILWNFWKKLSGGVVDVIEDTRPK
jgi:hypothetical protein